MVPEQSTPGSSKATKSRSEGKHSNYSQPRISESSSQHVDSLAEHDIFGGAVSDSEDEEEDIKFGTEIDDISRLSADDSRLSDTNSLQGSQMSETKFITTFTQEMFQSPIRSRKPTGLTEPPSTPTSSQPTSSYNFDVKSEDILYSDSQMSRDSLSVRLEEVRGQLQELQDQKAQREREVASMENLALKQRFQEMLDSLIEQIQLKDIEYDELQAILNQ